MKKFTYQFLKTKSIDPSLFSLAMVVADLKGKSESGKNNFQTLYKKLEKAAIVESIRGSSAIENIFESKEVIESIVNGQIKPSGHNQEEVAGYFDAIEFVSKHYEEIEFNEATIKEIHHMIVSRHPGVDGHSYKKADNQIAELDEDGSIKHVIFNPVSAKDTPKAMESLVQAYQIYRDDLEVNPLLLIPCVIVDFLSIHPFSDGNGRTSRLLTLLLLYKSGYDIGKYISVESMINDYKYAYYDALRKSQEGWNENANDYSFFITFTFQILYQCYKEINHRLILKLNKKGSYKEQVFEVILGSIVPLSKMDIAEFIPEAKIRTIEVALSSLIEEKKIRKIGTFKNAKYMKIK
ncbi:MAG: Fic family protein [Bacilli bacterium]|nr:Fic family protein [Bacilli bacterium]